MRPTIVCQPEDGIPEPLQGLIDSGEFDCLTCSPEMHLHRVPGSAAVIEVLVGHHDCQTARQQQQRVAGAVGLN